MKITVLDGYTSNPGDLSWDDLKNLGDVTIYDRTPVESIIPRIGSSEAIFTNKTPINKEVIESCPNLKFIGVLATGYNVVDVNAAKQNGIIVCNVPVYSTQSVAEFVFALILEIAHHVGSHNTAVKSGEWTNSVDFTFWNHPLFELGGKTLGLIGYGKIGQATAKLAIAFGMNVLAYSRTRSAEIDSDKIKYATLDELLANSDIISLHVPLTEETQGIINNDSISKCKDEVVIINTARGGVVVDSDIKNALENGKVSYFAADVATYEPIKADSPLLSAPNTILTPHIAWATKEARARLVATTTENLKAYIDGKPQNVVN